MRIEFNCWSKHTHDRSYLPAWSFQTSLYSANRLIISYWRQGWHSLKFNPDVGKSQWSAEERHSITCLKIPGKYLLCFRFIFLPTQISFYSNMRSCYFIFFQYLIVPKPHLNTWLCMFYSIQFIFHHHKTKHIKT